jgi:hypothetical protein
MLIYDLNPENARHLSSEKVKATVTFKVVRVFRIESDW